MKPKTFGCIAWLISLEKRASYCGSIKDPSNINVNLSRPYTTPIHILKNDLIIGPYYGTRE